jgi:hypothetical protein
MLRAAGPIVDGAGLAEQAADLDFLEGEADLLQSWVAPAGTAGGPGITSVTALTAAFVSAMVSAAASLPSGSVSRNSTSTDFTTSFVMHAWKICGRCRAPRLDESDGRMLALAGRPVRLARSRGEVAP